MMLMQYRIIKQFIEGKSFPSGYLSQEKQRHHIYDIVDVVTMD